MAKNKKKASAENGGSRSQQRVVRRDFTIHEALGNWMVRMNTGDKHTDRMLCLCTRQSDAHYIAAVLNYQHKNPPNAELSDREQ